MMTTTAFYNPNTVTNVTVHNDTTHQDSIDWIYRSNISPSNAAQTSKPLYTISGLWMEKFVSTTSQLWCTHCNIPALSVVRPQVGIIITGIETWNWHSGHGDSYAWNPGINPVFDSLYNIGDSIIGWTVYSSDNPADAVTITSYGERSLHFSNDLGAGPHFTAHSPDYSPQVLRPVAGIEFNLVMERYSRVEDLVIQLTLHGELIGENRASTINPAVANMYTADTFEPPLEAPGNEHVYGSATDLWGTTLTGADIADPTFGIVISFKSNAAYPHRDLAYLYQIGIRITYA